MLLAFGYVEINQYFYGVYGPKLENVDEFWIYLIIVFGWTLLRGKIEN